MLPGFLARHPLSHVSLGQGFLQTMYELQDMLKEVTGMQGVSLTPMAGAQGEFAGVAMIKAYHVARGDSERNEILVPDAAHGTNPATAVMCGCKVVEIPTDQEGDVDLEALRRAVGPRTAGIMLTNPSTLGVFERKIEQVREIVHRAGGLLYYDGANLNAILGKVRPGDMGFDVIHMNLHKTFSTPHGGGGPGAGPVCVTKELEPFLPVPRVIKDGGGYRLDENYPLSVGKVHAFYGNFGVLLRAYSYILSLGDHLKTVSQYAVLNANYIKEKLKGDYHLPFDRPCMHECVFTDKRQQEYHVATLDIAKRLMDHGFHPPTIYFPLVVSGAIMIEPTESESKETLDQFIDAMKQIAREAKECPDCLHESPQFPKVRRLDETAAARHPCLQG
jgi:glycine dehydrogenase subunit 2